VCVCVYEREREVIDVTQLYADRRDSVCVCVDVTQCVCVRGPCVCVSVRVLLGNDDCISMWIDVTH